MAIQTYDTHTMIELVRTIRPTFTFWLSLCFPRIQNFDTKYIDFDVVEGGKRLAPFVAPNIQGKPMFHQGYDTRRFQPAYIKPKDTVDPSRVLQRLAGEPYTGELSAEARRDAIITDILRVHREGWERRLEAMAAEAVVDGQVTVSGEGFQTQTVTFGRNSNNAKALTGSAQWGQSGIKPLQNIEDWATEFFRRSGFAPSVVVMGLDAWKIFSADADVKALLDIRRGTALNITISPGSGESIQYRGTDGVREYWTYNDFYENESGTVVEMLDQKTVVLLAPGKVEGVRAFGAILDPHAGYRASEFYPRNFITDDPASEWVMSQSAPLMIPTRPNATMKIKVLV
jgi:hypothetical protein